MARAHWLDASHVWNCSWDRKSGDILLAALSGISSRGDVQRYEEAGVAAVLIGETLMRAPDPTAMIYELLGEATFLCIQRDDLRIGVAQ